MPILKTIKQLNAQFLSPKQIAISPCLSYVAFLNNDNIQIFRLQDLIDSFDSYCQLYDLTKKYTFRPQLQVITEIEVSIQVHKVLIGSNHVKMIVVWADLSGNIFIRQLNSTLTTKLIHPESAPTIALNLTQNQLLIHFYSADYYKFELDSLQQGRNLIISTNPTGYSPFDKMVNIFPGIFFSLNYLIVDQYQLPFKVNRSLQNSPAYSRKSAVTKQLTKSTPPRIRSYQRRKSLEDSMVSNMSEVSPKQPSCFLYRRKYLVTPSPCQLFNIEQGIHRICSFMEYDFGSFSPFQYRLRGRQMCIYFITKDRTLVIGAFDQAEIVELLRITNLKSEIRAGGWISPYEVVLLDESGIVLMLSLCVDEIGQLRV